MLNPMRLRVAILLVAAIWSLWFLGGVFARDNGQWGNVDPAIRDWIHSLKNKHGIGCCDTADGYDAEWDTQGNRYRVRIEGQWYVVPPEAVLDVPNRLGVPKVWYLKPDGHVTIRCFLPGGGT